MTPNVSVLHHMNTFGKMPPWHWHNRYSDHDLHLSTLPLIKNAFHIKKNIKSTPKLGALFGNRLLLCNAATKPLIKKVIAVFKFLLYRYINGVMYHAGG